MNVDLQELASQRGLGALPGDVLALVPAPPDASDRLAAPAPAAPEGVAAALHARARRGPEDASTRVITEVLSARERERELFASDDAATRLPRPSGSTSTDWGGLVGALGAVPPLDLSIDPARHFERLPGFDLDAAWQLAQLEAGREVLAGDVAQQMLQIAATLERAHCPRWALAHLALMRHLGEPEAGPRMVEILLDQHAFGAAIDLAAELGDPSLEAYVAARTPEATLTAAGRGEWIERLGDAERLAATDIASLSRAELSHLVGLAELGLAQGVVVIDAPRFQALLARCPTWRHAWRIFTTLVCAASAESGAAAVDKYLASFGPDARLAVMLRAHAAADGRGAIAGRLVREVVAYPDWVAPWRALARFAVADPGAAMRLLKSLD